MSAEPSEVAIWSSDENEPYDLILGEIDKLTWSYAEHNLELIKDLKDRIEYRALRNQTITYFDLLVDKIVIQIDRSGQPYENQIPPPGGKDREGDHDRGWDSPYQQIIDELLLRVSTDTYREGRFMAAVFVVSKKKKKPGGGFFKAAETIGVFTAPEPEFSLAWQVEREDFCEEQRRRALEYYRAEEEKKRAVEQQKPRISLSDEMDF